MEFNLEKLVHLTPPEGADETLVCGPGGCAPVPVEKEDDDGESPSRAPAD
ncbi:hypothetical protein [Corynebacterium humireducens]|nr:hypothetical protein [Corynebacterium humireducens]